MSLRHIWVFKILKDITMIWRTMVIWCYLTSLIKITRIQMNYSYIVEMSGVYIRCSWVMTPGTPSLDPPFSRNFRRLVLGCIKTDFYNQILILQHFSRSTRFTFLCTAPNSNFQQKFIKRFDTFYWNICNFCKILIKIIIFRTDFDEISSEFHEIWWFY